MALTLYAHPFSSYSQKALIALYETGAPFRLRLLDSADPSAMAELSEFWPLRKFPALADGDRRIVEATAIVEYVDGRYPGPARLISGDFDTAIEQRMMDRVFDNYVMTPVQTQVFDRIRPPADRDAFGLGLAREQLATAYRWIDARMADRTWAAGETFSLADCAAAPALFYADWVQPIGEELASLRAYRARLLARPSVRRAVDEARPYRHLFPGGAPDRD